MATFGVTETGFIIPKLSEIQTDVNESLMTTFGSDVDLSGSSVFGQLSGIFAERESLIWQAMQDVYNSQYPDTAFGTSLDNVGALTAIQRRGALASTLNSVKLFGTAGTNIPSGTQFSVINQPLNIFSTTHAVILGPGANCIQTLSFSAIPNSGSFRLSLNGVITPVLGFSAQASDIQAVIRTLPFASECVVTGTYSSGYTVTFGGAGKGGLMSQPLFVISSNQLASGSSPVTITPTMTQVGVDQASVGCIATQTGPIAVNINTLTVIVTPISGLTNVLNTDPALLGRHTETDAAYRLRRAQELQITGGSTFNALIAKLLNVAGVTAVILFENTTDETDVNGLPPHSFEAFVQGGNDLDIAQAIFNTKPAGIQSFGAKEISALDSQGNFHAIQFSRPTQTPVYIRAVIGSLGNYPTNGDQLIAAALKNYGDTLDIGQTLVVSPTLISQLAPIPGINTLSLFVGVTPHPTQSNNITFAPNEVGIFDLSRITVSHV